jgi:hypothetical protein
MTIRHSLEPGGREGKRAHDAAQAVKRVQEAFGELLVEVDEGDVREAVRLLGEM